MTVKRNTIRTITANRAVRKPMAQYESLGSKIRKGIYEGIGDEGSLLRGIYDDEMGSTDPLFRFRDSSVGVDKFDRATIQKRSVDNLRASAAMGAAASASEPAAPVSAPPVTPNNNAVSTE